MFTQMKNFGNTVNDLKALGFDENSDEKGKNSINSRLNLSDITYFRLSFRL